MEDEVMKQIRTRLAAATSAAAALAKSLEAVDANTLQTLELWLAKQEGDLRCGDCRAQMPRGKVSSVCIACGSKRPPLPSTLQFDFRVSFAFLQFLETIHPPLKIGSSNLETVRPPLKDSWGENAVETSLERTEDIAELDGAPHSDQSSTNFEDIAKLDGARHLDQSSNNLEDMAKRDGASHLDQSSTNLEDMAKIDGASHLDQSSTNLEDMAKIDGASHLDQSSTNLEDMAKLDGASHLDQSSTNLEDMTKLNGATHLDQSASFEDMAKPDDALHIYQSSTNFEDMTKLNGAPHLDQSSTSLESAEVSKREPEVAFESAISSRALNSWDTEWDYPTSHSLSAKVQPEDNVQSEIVLKSSKEVTFAEPQVPEYDLSFFDSLGGMVSKDGNVSTETDADATFWDFQDTNPVNPKLASVGAMERFASDTSAFTTITDADSDSGDSSLDVLPPPKPPLDFFGASNGQNEIWEFGAINGQNDSMGSLKSPELGNVTGLESVIQPQVPDSTEDDSEEDWGDAEFVGSQVQPAHEAQLTSHVDLLPFPSGSSPLSSSFSSNIISGDVSMDKDIFLLDQSSPTLAVPNLLGASPGNFTDFGTGLETPITTEGQKSTSEEDSFKSIYVRSLSFGDFEKKSFDIDDLFKRSVSNGNLQGKDMAEGDELLKALQAPSIPKLAPRASEPGDDILNFLNLSPASPQVNTTQGSVSSTNLAHGRSLSFDTVELVPDEQGDEMFQFFHTRSHSAGSAATKSSAVEDSSSDKDILNKMPSMPKANLVENSGVHDDPFSFIHTAIAPSTQPEAVAAKSDTNNDDDDDDSFEWKSAETPATTPAETSFQTVSQPEFVPAPAASSQHEDLFQWTPPSKPSSGPGKPLVGSGSLSGLLSLAGGLPPSQIRTASMEDDLFAALSRTSSNTSGGAQNRQAADVRPQSATEAIHRPNPGDDSDDEFSDFVSTGAMPSAPLPTPAQPPAGHANQPAAYDVSFFEAAQPIPSEKRNLDFFGDLMGLNFTNA